MLSLSALLSVFHHININNSKKVLLSAYHLVSKRTTNHHVKRALHVHFQYEIWSCEIKHILELPDIKVNDISSLSRG